MSSPEASAQTFQNAYYDSRNSSPADIKRAVDLVQRAITTQLLPVSGINQTWQLPRNAARELDPKDPVTAAAMMSGAAAYRGFRYRDDPDIQETMAQFEGFGELWHETPLAELALKAQTAVDGIQPRLTGPIARIDVSAVENFVRSGTTGERREVVVMTGLNGCGKSSMIDSVEELARNVGIKTQLVKFPRPGSPFGEMARDYLAGKFKCDPSAIQLAFMADSIDFQADPDSICIFDRNPTVEAAAYGPNGTIARMAFSLPEITNTVHRVIIIDRHPAIAAQAVTARDTDPRVFERSLDQFIARLTQFVSLTALPGYYWVNGDVPADEGGIKRARLRTLETIIDIGLLHRYMIKQGLAENMADARSKLVHALLKMDVF